MLFRERIPAVSPERRAPALRGPHFRRGRSWSSALLLLAAVLLVRPAFSQSADAFDPGANGMVLSLARQTDGQFLVGGSFTTLGGQPRKYVGRLKADGGLDQSFIPGGNANSLYWGTDAQVNCVAVQPDGKVLLGGAFNTVGNVSRKRIARLNADGTLDTNFVSAAANNGSVNALVVLTNGQILVGGSFSSLGGQTVTNLCRLNADGTTDTNYVGAVSGTVNSLVLQPDNALVVGGTFSALSGGALANLGRLNADGSLDTNFTSAGASGAVYALALQTNGQVVVGGSFGTLNGANCARLGRLNPDGSLDTSFNPVMNSATVYCLALQANGQVLVGGFFSSLNGQSCTNLARLNPDGTVDAGFRAEAAGTATPMVRSVLADPDTHILVGGSFTTLAGQPRSNIGRVNADGSTEFSFTPNPNGSILALAYQTDGKLLVGGNFTTIAGQARKSLARFNVDGTLDPAFNPGVSGSFGLGNGGNSVYCLALQTNGQILVGGWFTNLAGGYRTSLGRINADGSLDPTFSVSIGGYYPYVYNLAVQTNGQILVGGTFSSLGGQSRTGLGRVSSTGALDGNFNPYLVDIYGGTGRMNSLLLQPDGKILLGGLFNTVNGTTRNNLVRLLANGQLDYAFNVSSTGGYGSSINCLALQTNSQILVGGLLNGQQLGRLNADGTLDTNFTATANGNVTWLGLQTDGRIILGGNFTLLNGKTNTSLGRLNADGTLDTNFNGGIQASYPAVSAVALRSDGALVVGGTFNSLGGQTRTNLGRLNNTDPATESLSYSGGTITWLRGGTSPEVNRATFEASTNGTDILPLAIPARIPGGWRLSGLSLPARSSIRGRGFLQGGQYNGSSWLVESVIGMPLLTTQPFGRTNNAGTAASFTVTASGSGPISYQWFRDGAPLVDSANLTGATSPALSLSTVFGADAGSYSVVVSNAFGSVTSRVAVLTVRDPFILSQPTTVTTLPGNNVSFSVSAAGTAPLFYQWRRNGTNVTGATNTTLALTNVQPLDAGLFDVLVTNLFGSVTSSAAALGVSWPAPDAWNPGANDAVWSMVPQPDGKFLVAGHFNVVGGGGGTALARLLADGTIDTNFNFSSTLNYGIRALALQPDGQVLVGGLFTAQVGGLPSQALVRLSPDGSTDPDFDAGVTGSNPEVYGLALQPDGKIVVGGWFNTLGGLPCNHLGRLFPDGTLDTNFLGGADSVVAGIALQPDGKVIACGFFSTLAGQPCAFLGRVNADGSFDSSFVPNPNNFVYGASVLPDGRILVGGAFSSLGGQACNYFGRLNADGTLDTSFNAQANGGVFTIAVQADGRILVGGGFTSMGGFPRNHLARLNPDGSLDTTFDPNVNNNVQCLALQADGGILLGGDFNAIGGASRGHIARLPNTGTAAQSLSFDGLRVCWMRGGTSPEIDRATFETSTNGLDWLPLGDTVRLSQGWRSSPVALWTNSLVRARGWVRGGDDNGSGWFLETSISLAPTTPPQLLTDDGGALLSENGFSFNVAALLGQAVVVESSTNLHDWVPAATVPVSASPFHFTDPNATNFPALFYRARLP